MTLNDPGDLGDDGGNRSQNFPVLRIARSVNGQASIIGHLDSRPMQGYRIEYFASLAVDASGHGEGRRFLGSLDVTTNAMGRADFSANPVGIPRRGEYLSATATDLG